MKNYLQDAKKLFESGLYPIPVSESKSPANGYKWAQFYEREMTLQDVESAFRDDCHGVAVLTGVNGLEVIDVDLKYDITGGAALFERIINEESPDLFAKLFFSGTRSGGQHWFYRCDKIEPNQKLACRPPTEEELSKNPKQKFTALIETRGTRGYVLVDPTPGYIKDVFKDWKDIPHITPANRELIFRCSRMCDEMPEVAAPERKQKRNTKVAGLTPWDDYNSQLLGTDEPVDILKKHGYTEVYTFGPRIFLKRPGNSDSKTSGNFHIEKGTLVIHSSNTEFEPGKGYSPYGVYAMLEHNGDFSAAAKALYREGYGDRIEVSSKLGVMETVEPEEENKFAKNAIDFWENIPDAKPVLWGKSCNTGEFRPVLCMGDLLGVLGPRKSRKTSIVKGIVASALAGCDILGWRLAMNKALKIVWIDTEQTRRKTLKDFKEVIDMLPETAYIGMDDILKRILFVGDMRGYSPAERRDCIRYHTSADDIGLIVIDGIKDICDNYNDEKKADDCIGFLMELTAKETTPIVAGLLHTARSTGDARGHLGNEFVNKYAAGLYVQKHAFEDGGDGGYSSINAKDVREFGDFIGMSFYHDEEGRLGLYADAF